MTTAPTRQDHLWSVTAMRTYNACPKRYAYTYGPSKIRLHDRTSSPTAQRGIVLHMGMTGAYRAAQAEAAEHPETYGTRGNTMLAYRTEAERAFNLSWNTHGMPRDGGLANSTLGALTDLLGSLPLPKPGAVLEVEQRHRFTTSTGLEITASPDLALANESAGSVLIRDWKSGQDCLKLDPTEDDQLNIYAAAVTAAYPHVRRVYLQLFSISKGRGVQGPATVEKVDASLRRIERTAATAAADQERAPRPGARCDGCPYRVICPAHQPAA